MLNAGVRVGVVVAVEVTPVGVGVVVQSKFWIISIAHIQALSTVAVPMISINPVVTVTAKLLSNAAFSPTAAKISTLLITVTPLMEILKTLSPAPVKYVSAFFRVTR